MNGKGFLHIFLITCCAIFAFPFIWMLIASMKTDEEVLKNDFFVNMPDFQPESPYLRDGGTLNKPAGCSEERWKEAQAVVSSISQEKIKAYEKQPVVIKSDISKVQEQAAILLTNMVTPKVGKKVWEQGNAEIEAAFKLALENSPGGEEKTIAKAFNDAQARFWIGGIKLRETAGGVVYSKEFSNQEKLPDGLSVENGTLVYDSDGKLVLQSDFSSGHEAVKVNYTFHVQESYEKLHRMILTLGKDDTWHQIDAEVKVNGVPFKTTRTMWLAQHRPESLVLQFPNDQREEFGKRPWVELEQVGEKITPKGEYTTIELSMIMTPSTSPVAAWGKVKRNYVRVLRSMPFWKNVVNSVILTLLIIFGAVFSSCFVAYAFARLKWPGRSIAFLLLLSTMMLPPQVTMIQQFIIWRELGWYNTMNPIWVPAWFGIAFFIFLMVQQMKGIPRDLEEAAQVDGMNRLQIWWYVIVPLVKPAMAAIAIMAFMGAWNEFMSPLIYLRDMDRFPLSVGMYGLSVDDGSKSDMPLLMAGNILMTIPVIVIFFLFQRYFIQGVASAGVKG